MSFNDITSDTEVAGQRSNSPAFRMEPMQFSVISLGQLRVQTATLIHRLRDRLDVIRIHAGAVATKMIRLKTLGPFTDPFFPDRAMRNRFSASDAHLSVAALANRCSLPDPARRDIAAVEDVEVAFVNQSYSSHGCAHYTMDLRAHVNGYQSAGS